MRKVRVFLKNSDVTEKQHIKALCLANPKTRDGSGIPSPIPAIVCPILAGHALATLQEEESVYSWIC